MELNPRTLARATRLGGLGLGIAAGLFVILWIGFIGQDMGFGTAADDPKDFIIVMLNGITAAGLYFVVASGFTLIFGLMRVVNMAHGSFFLFGGYIALKLQRNLVGEGGAFGLSSSQVSVLNWVVPFIVGTLLVGVDRPGHAAAPAALEPGPGPAPGADHDRRLDHPRRPDARPLRRYRRGHHLARPDRSLREPARVRGAVLRGAPPDPAARAGDRRGPLAVAAEDADRHGHPRGRRRSRDGERARHQHSANVCGGVLRRLGARRSRRRRRRLVRQPGARASTRTGCSTRSSS